MEQWILSWWHEIVFMLVMVVVPLAAWAIRLGLVSKDELAAETKAQAGAVSAVEDRLGERLDAIEKEQSQLSDRTLRIETEIGHLPTSDDIADLKTALARTEARFEGMMREIQSISRSITRVEDSLRTRTGP